MATDAQLIRLAAKVVALTNEAEQLNARLEAARAKIREQVEPGRHMVGKYVINVTPNRRFNPDLVPDDLKPQLLEQVVSPAKAKAELAPAVYDACMAENGKHRIRVVLAKDGG